MIKLISNSFIMTILKYKYKLNLAKLKLMFMQYFLIDIFKFIIN